MNARTCRPTVKYHGSTFWLFNNTLSSSYGLPSCARGYFVPAFLVYLATLYLPSLYTWLPALHLAASFTFSTPSAAMVHPPSNKKRVTGTPAADHIQLSLWKKQVGMLPAAGPGLRSNLSAIGQAVQRPPQVTTGANVATQQLPGHDQGWQSPPLLCNCSRIPHDVELRRGWAVPADEPTRVGNGSGQVTALAVMEPLVTAVLFPQMPEEGNGSSGAGGNHSSDGASSPVAGLGGLEPGIDVSNGTHPATADSSPTYQNGTADSNDHRMSGSIKYDKGASDASTDHGSGDYSDQHIGAAAQGAVLQQLMNSDRMGIAYSILLTRARTAEVSSCLRLLRAIYHEDNVVAVHLDAKAPGEELVALEAALGRDPLLRGMAFVVPRTGVVWGGVSMVTTALRVMSTLLRRDKPAVRWSYWINLSGSDYPLMTQESLRRVLMSLPAPMDFMPVYEEYGHLTLEKPSKSHRYLVDDPAIADAILLGRNRNVSSYGPSPYGTQRNSLSHFYLVQLGKDQLSFQWCKAAPPSYVFSRTTCEFLVEDPEGTVRDALVHLSGSFAPDELFYPTVLANSPRHRAWVHYPLMCTTWEPNASHATTLNAAQHWGFLTGCGTPFARKFLPGSAVLDRIDAEFLGNPGDNERRVTAALAAINGMFIPESALEFSAGPRSVTTGAESQLGMLRGQPLTGSPPSDHGTGLPALNCSAPYVFVSSKWVDANGLKATPLNDVCRKPFLNRGKPCNGWRIMKKTLSLGVQRGVTEFSESCCPCMK
eukprot:jgi/Mesvir1/13794/Mv25589-RA.1